jgi:predicted ATPase with chaperone activity
MHMSTTSERTESGGLLASLLGEDCFWPFEPKSLKEAGLNRLFIETLTCTYLLQVGVRAGREIAAHHSLPFRVLEELLQSLRSRQMVVHRGHAPLNDYYYALTDQGANWARSAKEGCGYIGPLPVPLEDYVLSVEAQSISAEAPQRRQLVEAFSDISIDTELLDSLGPAINSGAGMFIYGAPGNGKTTLARRITKCFGQHIWIPQAIIDDGHVIKLFDASVHNALDMSDSDLIQLDEYDHRWVKIRRPTVVVGGELTMDNLEMRHNEQANYSEAPLQLKSNCGCLLIDDFGRQRIEPTELLNRWIVPLENHCDYLTIATGKKIQVPFQQLIIFSTNLEPSDLTDEAFLRRIAYKIEVDDPSRNEFHELFQLVCRAFDCEYRAEMVDYLLETHYKPIGRPLRRCHPRDLMTQIRNYCAYQGVPMEMQPEYFDRVVKSYFTVVTGNFNDQE